MKTNIFVIILILTLVAAILKPFYESHSNSKSPVIPKRSLPGTRLNGVALGDTREQISRYLCPGWINNGASANEETINTWVCPQTNSKVDVWFRGNTANYIRCFLGRWDVQFDGRIIIQSGVSFKGPLSFGTFKRISVGAVAPCYLDTVTNAILETTASQDNLLESATLRYNTMPPYLQRPPKLPKTQLQENDH